MLSTRFPHYLVGSSLPRTKKEQVAKKEFFAKTKAIEMARVRSSTNVESEAIVDSGDIFRSPRGAGRTVINAVSAANSQSTAVASQVEKSDKKPVAFSPGVAGDDVNTSNLLVLRKLGLSKKTAAHAAARSGVFSKKGDCFNSNPLLVLDSKTLIAVATVDGAGSISVAKSVVEVSDERDRRGAALDLGAAICRPRTPGL